MKMHSIKEL